MAGKSKYSVADLERDLRKREPALVYVIEGEETLLATQATQSILDAVLPREARDFNLGQFSGDDETGRKFLAEAHSYPFLTERRVVILRRFDKLKLDEREEDEFLSYLKEPAATTVLVIVATKLDRRTTLAKELDKRARVVSAELHESELPNWVRGRFVARGVAASDEATRLLIDLAGPGLLDLGNEIDKLLARYADAKRIEASHVESTVDRHRLESAFAMADAFRPDNAAGFMKILARILETEGDDELFRLMGLMAWKVNLLLRIRLMLDRGVSAAGQIAEAIKRNPWQVEQTLPQARAFSRAQLLLWQHNLQRADVQMKSVSLSKRWVLERALLNSFMGREMA